MRIQIVKRRDLFEESRDRKIDHIEIHNFNRILSNASSQAFLYYDLVIFFENNNFKILKSRYNQFEKNKIYSYGGFLQIWEDILKQKDKDDE